MADEVYTPTTPQHMLFTGANYVKNHHAHVVHDFEYQGESAAVSNEKTCGTSYMFRASAARPPRLLRKHEEVGAIGWWNSSFGKWGEKRPTSKIQRGGFRTESEDIERHKIMTPQCNSASSGQQSSGGGTAGRSNTGGVGILPLGGEAESSLGDTL